MPASSSLFGLTSDSLGDGEEVGFGHVPALFERFGDSQGCHERRGHECGLHVDDCESLMLIRKDRG